MSEDSYTETTTKGLGSRLGDSIKGVLVGLVMVVAAFPVLFWNEGRAVQTAKSLKEGRGAVVSVASAKIDTTKNGKLVHFNGQAVTTDKLSDPDLAVSVVAIKLARKTEMYQWVETKKEETKKEVGGSEKTTTTYTYAKKWSGDVEDSSSFKKQEGHSNPGAIPYASTEWQATNVNVGAYKLPDSLIGSISKSEKLTVAEEQLKALPKELKKSAKVSGGGFYIGQDPGSPAIGDVQISYSMVKPSPVSVLGQQSGDSLSAFQTKAGDALLRLDMGTLTAAQMFAAAEAENTMLLWILRIVGILLMCIGLYSIFKPIAVMGDVIPFIGSALAAGLGLFAGLIGVSLSLVVIAVAWVFYRPLVGIPVLIVGIAGIVGLVMLGKKKKAGTAVAPLAAPPVAPAK
jgi:hypothetical protein